MADFRCPQGGGRNEFIYVQGYGFEDPLPGPRRNLIRIYANAIAYALILFLLMQNLAPRLSAAVLRPLYPAIRIYRDRFLASQELIEQINIFSSLLCYCVPVLILCAVLRIPARVAAPRCRLAKGVALAAVCVTFGSSAVGSGVSLLLSSLLSLAGLTPSGPEIAAADSPQLLLLTVISTALIPAVFEELLFRGVLLQSLRRFGDRFALSVSTLLFALLHRNLVQLPNALLTGAVLAFLMLRTGSLWVVMVCHFCNNLAPVLLNALGTQYPALNGPVAFLCMTFLYVLLGLGGLVLMGVAHPELLRPLRGEGKRTERYKYRSFFSSLPMAALVALLCVMILWNLIL